MARPLLCAALLALPAVAADIRIGIVGTDTSHVPAFTALLNDASHKDHIPGARVVAAYKGGSPDLPSSRDRVEKYAAEIKDKYGVEIVGTIPELLSKVDAVLLESVDGRPHLAQFSEIAKGRKPVFIDKPLSSTLADAREIARIAREAKIPWFSSSTLRYSERIPDLRIPGLQGVVVWAPAPLEEHHQLDLSWYGIHGAEVLFTLLGPGCVEVSRISSEDADVVVGKWGDGRLGVLRLGRQNQNYGATVFSAKEARTSSGSLYTGYKALVAEIVRFFQTRKPPVANEVTLEIFAFLDAAQRSKESRGQPVSLR